MIATLWLCVSAAVPGLAEAERLLADFEPDSALALLHTIERSGGRSHEDNVHLHMLLGQAYAYKADRASALAAFAELLTLDPGHVIDYGLPPQVTLLFEEARRAARTRPALDVLVSWPDGLATSDAVALVLRPQNDTEGRLKSARLRAWLPGRAPWVGELVLDPHAPTRALIPALAATSTTGRTLLVAAELLDGRGNGVHAGPAWQIPLAHRVDPAWYEHWWLWALVGAAAVAGTTAALVLSQPPPATVDGVVSWRSP
jgi:hypothetical protein